jgi:hypothetical protein
VIRLRDGRIVADGRLEPARTVPDLLDLGGDE